MKTLDELKAARRDAYSRMEACLNKAKADTGGILTDEQRLAYDADEKLFDEADKAVKAGEADLAKQASLKAKMPPAPQRHLAPNPGSEVVTLGNPRLAAEDDPKKGFKTHREFLSAVMDAGRLSSGSGGKFDERLNLCGSPNQNLTAGSDEQGIYSDPHGGFLLPAGFSPNLLSVMAEGDPIAPLTTKIPMENAVVNIPARTDKNHTSSVSGGLIVYRTAETQWSDPTRMVMEQVELRATMLTGLAYATEQLLARSPISFVALLEAGFKDEFTAKLMDERLNGTGVGMYEGVINSAATVSQAKETGQAGATIVKENIDKMRSRCWGYGNAVWLANHDTLPQLRSLVQSVGTGGAPVAYFSTTPDGTSTLDGRPCYFTEFAQTLGTVGDLVLCNWSQYLEGTLTGMSQAESVHVRFLNHERTFKFWMENDGRCWWRSALTPKRSSVTLSPIVTLATRS